MEFGTFQEAYLHHVERLLDAPAYVNAPRGRPSREIVFASYAISDPTQRHLLLPGRRPNYVFNFAEALWYLSGSDSLAHIAYYAPSIAGYSADGRTLAGTAYGRRMFGAGEMPDQWRQVTGILTADPDSRRAVVQLFDARELADPDNIDVACTLALQFLIRDGGLVCVAYMRANDCYRGMVSDVFSFTLIQEAMARELGLGTGPYFHCAGSLHLYEADVARANDLRRAGPVALPEEVRRFPAMPDGDNRPYLRALLGLEERMRAGNEPLSPADPDFASLPEYWRQIALLFEAYRAIVRRDTSNAGVLRELSPLYRWSLACRWPERYGRLW